MARQRCALRSGGRRLCRRTTGLSGSPLPTAGRTMRAGRRDRGARSRNRRRSGIDPDPAHGGTDDLVEPGRALAELVPARTARTDVRIITDTFEAAELPPIGFDIVAAATAFHWVDPRVGYRKSASAATQTGGSHSGGTSSETTTARPVRRGAAADTRGQGAAPRGRRPRRAVLRARRRGPDRRDHQDRGVRAGRAARHPLERTPRPHELRQMFATFSPWLALPDGRAQGSARRCRRAGFTNDSPSLRRPPHTKQSPTSRNGSAERIAPGCGVAQADSNLTSKSEPGNDEVTECPWTTC